VHVAKGERTCLGCGETFSRGICPRCGLPEPGEKGGKRREDRLPPTVLTESYLRPEEYRLLGM
jgi:predicted amidophosphoribosyltransferase